MTHAPTPPPERIVLLDVLRGFALFGVIVMNIPAMGLHEAAAFNPAAVGTPTEREIAAWAGASLLFEGGMRTLFSMLFGAGFLLFLERQDRRGGDGVRLFLRRAALLMAFGLFDRLALLWTGDILLPYGLAALALLPLRRANLPALATIAAVLALAPIAATQLDAGALAQMEQRALETQDALASGAAAPEDERALADWRAMTAFWSPSPEDLAADAARARRGWAATAAHEAGELFSVSGALYVFSVAMDALLGMILGLIAYRVGLLRGAWRAGPLWALALVGGVAALVVNAWEIATLIRADFSFRAFAQTQATYDVGRIALAAAWLAIIALLVRAPVFAAPSRALAEVGRMALTNYLLHSLWAAILFVGFGLYGALDRIELYATAAAFFALNLLASRLWLARFSLGPAELIWRIGVYGRVR